MATIPLPALDVKSPAAPPNPLEQYAQIMGIKNAQQELAQRKTMAPLQQQLAQQQVQGGQMDMQQKQISLNDQKGMSALMHDWATGAQGAKSSAGATPAVPGQPAPAAQATSPVDSASFTPSATTAPTAIPGQPAPTAQASQPLAKTVLRPEDELGYRQWAYQQPQAVLGQLSQPNMDARGLWVAAANGNPEAKAALAKMGATMADGSPTPSQPSSASPGAASAPAGAGDQGSSNNAPPSYDDLSRMAMDPKYGLSWSAVQGLQAHVLDIKAKASTIAKDNAYAGSSKAETTIKNNSIISDAMMGVSSLPDAQLPVGILRAAQELYGKGIFDPQHMQQAQQLAQLAQTNPTQARQQLNIQALSLGAFSKELENQGRQLDNQKKAGAVDPTSPYYDPSAASVALGTAPRAGAIQAGEARLAGQKAGAEAAARQPYEMALAAQRQALSQGDPNAAGQLLVNGDATLSELKSRGATPDFIVRALNAAHRLSGGSYNAQAADAQYSVAKSPANVAFFGSAKSLTNKGGTLDQLQSAGRAIPGGQIPAFNSIADWKKAASGSGPIAKYASLALGVADDYSKVMGGGQGSDTSRLQALKLVGANQSPSQRSSSIDGIRGAVGSQINSRIGKNPVLGRMYGTGGEGGQQPAQSNGNDPFAQFGGRAH